MDSKQLHELMKASVSLDNSLTQLRDRIVDSTVPQHAASPSQWLLEASNTRNVFRTLAETLEANRNLVQLNKEKIEKSRVFLEGLEYYKTTLRNKIKEFHIDAQPIDDYLDKPLGDIDWQNNYQEGEQRLKQSLESIRNNNEKYREGIQKKNELDRAINEKRKLYRETIPRQVKSLSEQVAETSKLFGCELNEVFQKIQSPKLAYIFDEMKVKKRMCNIEVTYTKDEYESLEVVIKPSGMDLFEVATKNKIQIEEKQIKIRIADLNPVFRKLVIGVDRRCNFSTKEIFTRIVNREEPKLLFEAPTKQIERNYNSKYVYLDWLEEVLCSSIGEGSNFIDIIRERVFSLNLTKFIFENLKKMPFFFQIPSAKEGQAPINLKKLNVDSVAAITFKEYKEIVYLPPTLLKAINSYEISSRQLEIKKAQSMLGEEFEEQYKLDAEKVKIMSWLKSYHLSEMVSPNLFTYHKITLTYYTLKVVFVILLPLDYPTRSPEMKVISFERIDEKVAKSGPAGIPEKGRFQIKNGFSQEAQELQMEGNRDLSGGEQSSMDRKVQKNFCLLFKLNHILTVLWRLQNSHHLAHRRHD